VQRLKIQIAAPALEIRPFIPFETEPFQIFHDRNSKFIAAARSIEILDSQNQPTAGSARSLLRPPKRHCVAQMQVAGRRRRNSSAVCDFRFQIANFRLTSARSQPNLQFEIYNRQCLNAFSYSTSTALSLTPLAPAP